MGRIYLTPGNPRLPSEDGTTGRVLCGNSAQLGPIRPNLAALNPLKYHWPQPHRLVPVGTRIGLDPVWWTSSERRIRCPAWPSTWGAGLGASSRMNSRRAQFGWFWTKANQQARWLATWI